jgi:hypothetical protein
MWANKHRIQYTVVTSSLQGVITCNPFSHGYKKLDTKASILEISIEIFTVTLNLAKEQPNRNGIFIRT